MTKKIFTHEFPVLREEADFIIMSKVDSVKAGRIMWEQLWTKRTSDNEFKICCIPFFVYDLALGDVVRTDKEYIIEKLIQQSGHYTFRIWFEHNNSDIKNRIIDHIIQNEYLIEQHSDKLYAIDAENKQRANDIAAYFKELEERNELEYETGR